jgi:hypothetical protein
VSQFSYILGGMADSLKKEIKQKGDGVNFPKKGDVLMMHYVRVSFILEFVSFSD